jgi:hypothetical protein
MKKTLILFLLFSFAFSAQAQKKNKGKNKSAPEVTDYQLPDSAAVSPAPVQKKGKGKNKPNPATTDYQQPEAIADTLTKFTGIIKYRITTDDPADKDSMFIIFGENRLRITMFFPGSREDQTFETNMIADIKDSSLYILDNSYKTYKTEKLSAKNPGAEISLSYFKKNTQILKFNCQEYSGEMKTPDGEVYNAAALVSKQHSFLGGLDYNFLNIQPVVVGYKIVLGWRTKTQANENTYIIAYKIEPGNTESLLDLSGYTRK